MKRLLLGLGLAVVAAMGAFTSLVSAQDSSNFIINSFDVDYYLSKDKDGRSTLKTVERITATFPTIDQNHGLERAIPRMYDGHSTSLRIDSVTDEAGQSLPYSDRESANDNHVIRIGDADRYVHGMNTYVITYTQRDVTRFFSNTNADEFYWDVNGTGWAQPIESLQARIHMPNTLSQKLSGGISCYRGAEGSTNTCPISRESVNDEEVIALRLTNIGPRETATFAIGFAANTFTAYQPSWQERVWTAIISIWIALLVASSVIAVVLLVRMSIWYSRLQNRIKGRGTIVPEYLPPKDTSVLVSAQVLGNAMSDVTAQLIDLAVRHYLKIYQTKEKTVFKSAEYEIEIVKPIGDLAKEEQRLIKDLFGSNAVPGSRFNMATLRTKYAIGAKLMAGRKAVQESVRGMYALYEHAEADAKRFKKFGFILLVLGVLTLSPVAIIVSVVAFIFMSLSWPLTQKGVELRDYLKGLKEYITVAETDRIKMLQSPEGAEKVGEELGDGNSSQLVKLYERVLPYAVLFGVEKEWTKQLGAYYETSAQQPDWYVGNGAFNAVVFSSALSSFSSQSSMYSASTSSSSGGSGGGGSSGGGGGGGGGGGW